MLQAWKRVEPRLAAIGMGALNAEHEVRGQATRDVHAGPPSPVCGQRLVEQAIRILPAPVSSRSAMRIAFCTNIRPVADPSSLRGRNHALVQRLRAAGHEVDVLHGPEKLLRGDALPSYDVGMLCPNDLVEARADPSGRLRADTVAVALERAGVRFLNSPLLRRFATNKLLTHVAMASAGLPAPDAWTLAEIDRVDWPPEGVLVKPVTGSGGLGVAVVHSREDASRHVSATSDQCFLQRLVPDARCIRVVATQHASVGRYEKRVPRGTIVAAITSGAQEVKLDPRDDLDRLAVAMTRAVEMDIAGADILETPDGALFGIEVNANFGFYPRNREIVDAIVEQLHAVARRSRPARSAAQLDAWTHD